jgi:hypothetical protein
MMKMLMMVVVVVAKMRPIVKFEWRKLTVTLLMKAAKSRKHLKLLLLMPDVRKRRWIRLLWKMAIVEISLRAGFGNNAKVTQGVCG